MSKRERAGTVQNKKTKAKNYKNDIEMMEDSPQAKTIKGREEFKDDQDGEPEVKFE